MSSSQSIKLFNSELIKRNFTDLTMVDYCYMMINTKSFDIPFNPYFVNYFSSDEFRDSKEYNLIRYEVVNDENNIKDHLISHGYRERR